MGFTGIHDTPSIQSYVKHVVPGPTNSVVAVAAKTSIIASQVSKYSKKYIYTANLTVWQPKEIDGETCILWCIAFLGSQPTRLLPNNEVEKYTYMFQQEPTITNQFLIIFRSCMRHHILNVSLKLLWGKMRLNQRQQLAFLTTNGCILDRINPPICTNLNSRWESQQRPRKGSSGWQYCGKASQTTFLNKSLSLPHYIL